MNTHLIGHIDADCFYVSCERVRDQRLKGKPVGVLGNQGACVIARSYEMRPSGVKVGMPIWKAKQLCPDGIYIKRDFQWYEILSKQMQDILHQYSDVVEYYSVDESFVDFGNSNEDQEKLASHIQHEILQKAGVPVSIGFAETRTLAKMASEKRKPFGITIVKSDNLKDFLQNCLVEEIPGIGQKLQKRIPHLKTTLDYIQEPQAKIRQLLHKPGEEFWYELQGKIILPIRAKRPERKIISRGGSIWGHHQDPSYIWGFLVRNLERFTNQLVKENIEIHSLTVLLITSQGLTLKTTENLSDYTNSFSLLLKAAQKAFQEIFRPIWTYSHVHLFASPLRSIHKKQLSLFEEEKDQDTKVLAIKQQINAKHGAFTLRSGATAFVPQVFADETSNYEICDIDGKICF